MTVLKLEQAPAWVERYHPGHGWRIFDWDDLTGKTEWFRDDGTAEILTLYPVQDMLDFNEEMRTFNSGRKWDDGMAMAARIPMHIWQRELAEAIKQEDKPYISRWLNDPDHAYFRTKEGKV